MPQSKGISAQQLPEPFLNRMKTVLGDEYADFIRALGEDPVIALRINPRKPAAEFGGSEPVPWTDKGIFLAERPKFFLDPLIHAGAYYVQESSSMLPAMLIPGDRPLKVLDLCASPGGKSTHLISRLHPDSLLVSNEMVGSRATVLAENISKWGYPNVVVTNNKPADFHDLYHFFDYIFVDAPCSGEGMFRKDPKVAEQWTEGLVRHCALRQQDILRNISPCLKPGGFLVYSTCTFAKEENEAIVDWAVSGLRGDFQVKSTGFEGKWGLRQGFPEGFRKEVELCLRCFPHLFKGEGFFLGLMQKTGNDARQMTAATYKAAKKKNRHSGYVPDRVSSRKLKVLMDNPDEYEVFRMDDRLIAHPALQSEDMLMIREKLRVVRSGVLAGQEKGKDIIPHHDLAMSGLASANFPRIELEKEEALKYLRREPLQLETSSVGWALATFKGTDLGWLKVLKNRANSHFPKSRKLRN